MAKMHVAMNELPYQNQTLEDNFLNIQHRHQKTNPLKEMKVLDP